MGGGTSDIVDDVSFYSFMLAICLSYIVMFGCYLCYKLFRTIVFPYSKNAWRLSSFTWKGCLPVMIHSLMIVGAVLLSFHCYTVVNEHFHVFFDPYEILQLSTSRGIPTTQEIKKAYRALSQQFHPDKNKGSSEAAKVFTRIAKAYEALTDPIARKNYEKYGHPDGPQAYLVSFSMPAFMTDKSNQFIVLASYAFLVLFLLPGIAYYAYRSMNSSSEGGKKTKVPSKSVKYIVEHLNLGTFKMYEAIILIASLPDYAIKSNDKKEEEVEIWASISETILKEHKKIITEEGCRQIKRLESESIRRTCMALYCHLLRPSKLSIPAHKLVEERLSVLLPSIPCILETMASVALEGGGDEQSVELLRMLPYMAQGCLSVTADALDEQMKRVQAAKVRLPSIQIEAEAFVEGEDEIQCSDLLTCQMLFTRKYLEPGESADPVATLLGEHFKEETYWIVVQELNSGDIQSLYKITNLNRKVKTTVKFWAPTDPGTYAFDVHVYSTAYLEVETSFQFTIKVLGQPIAHPSPEDLKTFGDDMLDY